MNDEKSGTRTREIEILRLWCTIAVCMHHLRYCSEALPYGGGYLAVDCFLILSGFYLRKGYVEKKSTNYGVITYIKGRYIRLFKDYIIAFLIALLVNLFVFKVDIINNLNGYIREAFMIEFGSVESALRMNPPDWYCGYFIISSVVVYVLQSMLKKHVRTVSLIMGSLLYGLLAIVSGHLCVFPIYEGFSFLALVRAIAGQLIGVFLFEIYIDKRECEIPKNKAYIVFCVGFLMISYMLFLDTAFGMTDYVCVVLFGVLIYLSQFIEIGWLCNISEKVWSILPRLVYVSFLNHYIIVKIFAHINIFNYLDWKIVSVIYIICVFAVSYMILQMRNIIQRFLHIKTKESNNLKIALTKNA